MALVPCLSMDHTRFCEYHSHSSSRAILSARWTRPRKSVALQDKQRMMGDLAASLTNISDSPVFRFGGGGAALRLRYFDCRGLAETTRDLLAIHNVGYADDRFPFTFGTPGDFTTIKRPEFDAAQRAGAFAAGLGKVPLLEVGGEAVPQSKAIERYVARTLGMVGANELEAAQIDAVTEHVRDIKQAYQPHRACKAEDPAAAQGAWFSETLPEYSRKLEAALPACVRQIDPACPNHAHVALYTLYNGFFDNAQGAQNAIVGCPALQHIVAVVGEHPGVQAWETTRPKTDF